MIYLYIILYIYKWDCKLPFATDLTEEPPTASLSHLISIPLLPPRDLYLCVVNAFWVARARNEIYALLAFIWIFAADWQ